VEPNNFFQIKVGTLIPNTPFPFDLYVLVNRRHIHYLRQGEILTLDKISKLSASEQFFVPMEQRSLFKGFIFSSLNEGSIGAPVKARILRDASLSLVEEIYEKKDISNALDESKDLIGQFVNMMDSSPESIDHLLELSSHDFYTFNHSLDVAVYSLGIGRMMNYSEKDMVELGRGAIFHDIGKKWVDAEIICKKGTLSDAEWTQMQRHPEYGLKILSEYEGATDAIKACCFEHHESFLGNGYPQGLDAASIHPMARIVAIADTFDALTTQRSYNQPMTPRDAILFMTTKIKDKYDPEILKAMSEILLKIE
jgi:HD-GYP domain-containing protein (c-di-GMP phosphodiesterase class II)